MDGFQAIVPDEQRTAEGGFFPHQAPAPPVFSEAMPAFPRAPSRAEAKAARQRDALGEPFPLHKTGGEARVRRLTLADLIVAGGLPGDAQAVVMEAYRQATERRGAEDGPPPYEKVASLIRQQQEIVDLICVQGFVSPRLVRTEAEADAANDPGVLWTGDLHREERERFANACLGQNREDAHAFRPLPAAGLGGDAALPAVPDAAAPVAGAGAAAGGS